MARGHRGSMGSGYKDPRWKLCHLTTVPLCLGESSSWSESRLATVELLSWLPASSELLDLDFSLYTVTSLDKGLPSL